MTIPYFKEEIEFAEDWSYDRPFIGYISPRGQLVDFTCLIGNPGHGNWRNPITPLFITYISYVLVGDNIEKYKDSKKKYEKEWYEYNHYEGFSDIVLRGPTHYCFNDLDYDSFLEMLNRRVSDVKNYKCPRDEWEWLKLDLMLFFEKCYSKRDFFDSFGQVVKVYSEKKLLSDFGDILRRDGYDMEHFHYEGYYNNYVMLTLMDSYFKEVLVRYLGYDSIERAIPDGWQTFDLCKNLYQPSGGYKSNKFPYILTSCSNPNERFYNWILMDWGIRRVDGYLWDEKEKKYVPNITGSFYQSDKEIELGLEIEAIKSEIPLQYRHKYFK